MLTLLVCALATAPQATLPADGFTPKAIAYADVELRWSSGRVQLIQVRRGRFERPTALRRWRGRFQARALKGTLAAATVEFDFPLLAHAETEDVAEENRKSAERLRGGLTATVTVRVPLPDGSDGLEIYDSQTRAAITAKLEEPPGAPRSSPPAR